DITGDHALGNNNDGVHLERSDDVTIGGTGAGEGNVIAASGLNNVLLWDTNDTTILGNEIGVGADRTTPLGAKRQGIAVGQPSHGADHNTIGGTAAGAANTIADNQGAGVGVSSESTWNAIRGNRIYANGGLGFDLGSN